MNNPDVTELNKGVASRSLKRMVSLLRSGAETLDKLAKEYKRIGWDLTAERLEAEASEHRRSANSFEQANDPSSATADMSAAIETETPSAVRWSAVLDALAKISARHEWDRERSVMEGNLTAATIFAIKKDAVESARRELESASNDQAQPREN